MNKHEQFVVEDRKKQKEYVKVLKELFDLWLYEWHVKEQEKRRKKEAEKHHHKHPGSKAVKLELTLIFNGKTFTGDKMITLTDVQKYSVRIKDELDGKGNVVPTSGPFTFTLSDDSLGTLTNDADGLGTTFSANKTGSGTIVATDTGVNIQATSSFTVIAGAPVTIELTESAPDAQ